MPTHRDLHSFPTRRSSDLENYGHYDDPAEVALYDKMLRETDPARQRELMRQLEKYVLDEQAHEIWALWWHRIVPYRSYLRSEEHTSELQSLTNLVCRLLLE